MRTETYTITETFYNFDELSREAKDFAKQEYFYYFREYEEYGKHYFYDEIEDCEFSEWCEDNNYEFYEDGTIYAKKQRRSY